MTRFYIISIICCFALCLSYDAHTQTPQTARGVIRLKVRYKSAASTKDLPRKRFFLIKGSLDQNQSLIQQIKQTDVASRECYYRGHGASEQLIKWMDENDCESVYCRQIEDKYIGGSEAVPEFKAAYDQALKELKTPEVARRWLPNYLPVELRDGYSRTKTQTIEALVKQAEKMGLRFGAGTGFSGSWWNPKSGRREAKVADRPDAHELKRAEGLDQVSELRRLRLAARE